MKTIGLDAGHGLNTAGKQTPDGIKEWTLNDKVRDKIVAILKDYDVKIINVDNDEGRVDESLASRLNAYLNANVDAFVSIHHNAYTGTWNGATGVEVYTDRNCTTKDSELAKAIYEKLSAYTGLKGRGIKKANFAVINQNKIPAVLVEGGFMDGSNDYKVITSDAGQSGYARAVAEGLIKFLNLTKKVVETPKPAAPAPVSTPAKNTTTSAPKELFKVKITCQVLNIRKGPGTNYGINGVIRDRGIYTIVEKKGTWGKLKSGAGWISLNYTKKV